MGWAHEKVSVHTDEWYVEEDCMWTALKPPALGCLDSSEGKYQKELVSDPSVWKASTPPVKLPSPHISPTFTMPSFHRRALSFFGMF